MAKQKQEFLCSNCDYRSFKWVGCCPTCNEWGSLVETKPMSSDATSLGIATTHATPAALTHLASLTITPQQRLRSGIEEWDRILGGGIVPGSFNLLTGDPGIGKSTLLLQVVHEIAKHAKVIYCSSEESLEQVHGRAQRLGCLESTLLFTDDVELGALINCAHLEKPDVLVIDSIQNCYTAGAKTIPGSIGQLREAAFGLLRLAKEHNIAVIATGHITKEGVIAGPKMLEHMVDGVFYLQGEDRWQGRMLRSVKNRFGSIHDIGFFSMHEDGMHEVNNINAHLITDQPPAAGAAMISYLEGTRPLLIELQALSVPSKLTMPQRVISGIDHKQVVLIAAILEKYLRIKLSEQDIFFKIGGIFKIKDQGADLGIALALLSSYYQKPLPPKSLVLGELSLTGAITPINRIAVHLQEAEKFGINHIIMAKDQKIEKHNKNIKRFANVYELLNLFTD